jgi:hypothetical protein
MIAHPNGSEEPILPALLGEMLDRLGVEPEQAQAEAPRFATASRRCLRCAKQDSCAIWLERERSRTAAPAFCPNAAFLRRLATVARRR